ncbi:MAG TPA: alpha/beta hydrolase [Thermoanaerobaculia bacterium]
MLKDRLRYYAARMVMRLPDGVKIRMSGEPPIVIDGQQLDPQVQLLRSVRRKLGSEGLVEPTVEAGRARYRRDIANFRGPVTKVASVRDFSIGALRVRHYVPFEANAPLTVYLHGGGFVLGDLDTHDEPCRILCREGGTHVLAVDYRLAPEHPFPAALDDTQQVLLWAQANAASLGADVKRVAIGGDSAGANLSTVASRLAAREGHAPFAQLLIYPPTDGITSRRSHDLFGKNFFLSNRDRDAFELHYIGETEHEPHPLVSPLYAKDLHELPPALIVLAGFDILRDEGLAYAEALQNAGTPVRLQSYPSLGHGFIHMTGVAPAARRAMVAVAREWREISRNRQ